MANARKWLVNLWSEVLGQKMSTRLIPLIIPNLRWNQEIFGQILGQYVKKEGRWLDAGCGHQLLPDRFQNIEKDLASRPQLMVGIDLDVASLRKHRSIRLVVCSNLAEIPFLDGTFDLLACNMVVEHLRDPSIPFREFARVLREDGTVIIHTPNALNYLVCTGRLLKSLLPRRVITRLVKWSEYREPEDIFPTFYRANTPDRLPRLMRQAGFSEEKRQMLVNPKPVCSFFAPAALVELLVMRATMSKHFCSFAATMVGVYRKNSAYP